MSWTVFKILKWLEDAQFSWNMHSQNSWIASLTTSSWQAILRNHYKLTSTRRTKLWLTRLMSNKQPSRHFWVSRHIIWGLDPQWSLLSGTTTLKAFPTWLSQGLSGQTGWQRNTSKREGSLTRVVESTQTQIREARVKTWDSKASLMSSVDSKRSWSLVIAQMSEMIGP